MAIISGLAASIHGAELDKLVGQPADIAPSPYQYRSDRQAGQNAPESWLAVMRFAGQPLNQPADTNTPAVRRVLCAFLWEEIRPIRQVELTWPADEKRRPAPEILEITTLDHQGSASSWWNNLKAERKSGTPASADGGSKLLFNLSHNTCGVVISVAGGKPATDYAVPAVRVLVADTWKKMDLEIEWGYDAASAQKDYSGCIETYDGIVGELAPLDGDAGTTVGDRTSWHSSAKAGARRGVKASLLTWAPPNGERRFRSPVSWKTWRAPSSRCGASPATSRSWPRTSRTARSWRRSMGSSCGGLRHCPSRSRPRRPLTQGVPPTLLTSKMDNLLGNPNVRGWGQPISPWFAVNDGEAVTVQGITFPARGAAMHPGSDCDVAVVWKSPFDGKIGVRGKATHIESGGGDGVTWSIAHETIEKMSGWTRATSRPMPWARRPKRSASGRPCTGSGGCSRHAGGSASSITVPGTPSRSASA